jgi:signal transduction histidine kinase
MTLRARLALFIAVTIALALLAQGVFGYLSFQRLLLSNLDRDLGGYVGRLLADLRFGTGPDGDDGLLGRGGRGPRTLEGYVARARLVQNGTVLRTWGEFPSAVPLAEPAPLAPGPSRPVEIRSYSSWRVASLRLGPSTYLQAAIQSQQVETSLANYRSTVVFTALLVSLLGAVAAFLLSGPVLRPLRHLLETTARVAHSGDLSLRVPEAGGGELRQLSHTFNEMMERLSAFLRRETEFTRNAAHELRTPLAAVRLQLGSYASGQATPEETLAVVGEEVERMTRLSEALLTLAREGRSQRVGFDLAELAREMAGGAGATYAGPEHLELTGDPLLLRQALGNLLDNARKYAPGAEVRVELEIQGSGKGKVKGREAWVESQTAPNPSTLLSRPPDYAVLSVTDNGLGMSPEALRRAAEPFYRAPGNRTPGSGLGLSVVARVAEAHGGRLELKTNPPHGLRVEVWLAR